MERQTTPKLREEQRMMKAAEANMRRLKMDECFVANPIWQGRAEYLRTMLQPIKGGDDA